MKGPAGKRPAGAPAGKLTLADGKTPPNPEAMRSAAKQLGVRLPKSRGAAADQELLGALRMEVGKRLAGLGPDDTVQCLVCHEISTEDTALCPYCGDPGKDESGSLEIEEVASHPATPVPVAPAPDSGDESDDDGDPDDTGEDGEDGADEDVDPDDEADDEEYPDSDEAENKPEPLAARAPKTAGAKPTKPGKPKPVGGMGIAAKPAQVAANVDAALAANVEDLDKHLSRIHELKRSAVGLSYDIGIECKEIRDRQLFKARGYASFKAFAEKELPFTRESALQLVSIVDKYSREDYGRIGYAKLRVISAVSDVQVKEELLAAAKKGATRDELADRAARGSSAPGAVSSSPKPEKAEKITLLGKVGARAQIVRFSDVATGEVLETVGAFKGTPKANSVYGEVEISAGVYLRIGLRVNDKNELEGLTVRFVRSAEGDE